MPQSIRDKYPLRLFIGTEDCTQLLDDGATFSNVDPGGYEMASFPIPKDMPQSIRGMPVRIDCGLGVAWEGRISQIQRSLGSKTLITCEGYAGRLKDTAVAMIFVDRDLTAWQQPSVQESINLVNGSYSPAGPELQPDPSGNPSLVTQFTGPWATSGIPLVAGMYDSHGIPISLITYAWQKSALVDNTNPSWQWDVFLSTDDLLTTYDTSGNLRAAGPGSGQVNATAGNRVYAFLKHQFNTFAGGGANISYGIYWSNVAVYGNHGLPGRGVSAPYGFYPSDIAKYAAQQASGLQLGTCPDMTGYTVPHSVYYTPVTLDSIIGDMAQLAAWHWGVWESPAYLTGSSLPRFDFRPRPAAGTFTAFAHRRNCDTLDIREDLSSMYDTAIVTYNDVVGVQRSVTVTVDNPILDQAGLHRTVVLSGGTMTASTATVFAQEALVLLAAQARVQGSVAISQTVDGPNGPIAPWMLKAGIDRLRVGDLPSTDAWGQANDLPLTRVECSISSSGITTSLEVGQGANLVESLQSRLQAATTLAGQGGV